ncbi:ATP-binding protein [candidate division WOR-3 bacterium]|nr:ATP-binding protein [candidate division WOR-3 bacterium]
MKEEELLQIVIPEAQVKVNFPNTSGMTGKVSYALKKDTQGLWHLAGELVMDNDIIKDKVLIESEEIMDILQDALSVDQYCQDEDFQKHQRELALRLALQMWGKKGIHLKSNSVEIELEPYILQQHTVSKNEANLLKLLFEEVQKKIRKVKIPDYLKVKAHENFIPDKLLLESLLQRIYENVPAIAILGPTGSGKSAMAWYVGARLNQEGFGIYTIDGHARLEGDRLFERDDFDQKGTFILEGILLRLARETKRLRIRLLVILEEYNAFSDETRREFYRLFSDENRVYQIQSSKSRESQEIDFSHVQFLLTGNPLSSDRYLTDDLRRLSNAETRRLVILYQDYAQEPATVQKILQAIVSKKEAYEKLKAKVSDLDKRINWKLGVDIFKALNSRKDGDSLGFDVGYSAVADMLWTATLRAHQSKRFEIAITEHILNGIPDVNIRQLAVDRIRQAANIAISGEVITRDT